MSLGSDFVSFFKKVTCKTEVMVVSRGSYFIVNLKFGVFFSHPDRLSLIRYRSDFLKKDRNHSPNSHLKI